MELYCEAIGSPIPEIQWWFEGNDPNETYTQLWDGAWQDRVRINATYNLHSTSTISIANLTADDSGMYECRASNDPDRNHLSKSPKVKWIRSQANVFVIEREWPHSGLGTCSDTGVWFSRRAHPCTRVLWLPKAPPTLPPAVDREIPPCVISLATRDVTQRGPAQKVGFPTKTPFGNPVPFPEPETWNPPLVPASPGAVCRIESRFCADSAPSQAPVTAPL